LKVVLLAGGLGTRLAEETDLRPKPMVELGGMPILWHIMQIYAAHGFTEFVVALGYKQSVIKDWFIQYYSRNNDVSVDLATGDITVHRRQTLNWKVHLVDTGLSTQTGGRLARLRPWLDEPFLMTYGDGVGDIDIGRLVESHRAHGRMATVTAVRPPSRFGGMTIDASSGRVTEFREKPQTGEGWINGGFFVLEPAVLDYIGGDDTPWELEPLERLAAQGDLVAYRHDGFWLPMDSLRDKRTLEAMWQSGTAPWKVW
jgi:glucose-1-phosphate cytidylyltransferase